MEQTGPERNTIATVVLIAGVAVAALLANATGVRAAWDELSHFLSLSGKPEPASANVLSEHHAEELDAMAPQAQAEFLLERSMNHYAGANEQIQARLASWRGKVDPSDRFESLFRMAINSDDLRVRAAAIEIDILARKLDKTPETEIGRAHV